MKKPPSFLTPALLLVIIIVVLQISCNNPESEQKQVAEIPKTLSQSEMIARGKYLVTIMGCNDCHSPKKMTAQGPVPDSAKLLSGHPAGMPMSPIDKNALKPGNWMLFAADLTATVGPWGISYPANLTPDSTTGIGAWSEYEFIQTLRTGKHLGQAGGRQILPPMPWEEVGQASDDDLKAIFAYLKALPPINNKVPAPVPPNEVAKMK
jgi:Cytochrome c